MANFFHILKIFLFSFSIIFLLYLFLIFVIELFEKKLNLNAEQVLNLVGFSLFSFQISFVILGLTGFFLIGSMAGFKVQEDLI